jgi:hypothetical protein
VSRIVVLCEGHTEELAVRYFIARQWQSDGLESVALKPINLRGKPQDVGESATRYLGEPDVLAVFTLVDLQGNNQIVHEPQDSLEVKVQRVQDWLRAQVTHARADQFFPHICVHETEAWILAEGHALAKRLQDPGILPDPKAEVKNFQNPPSKRVNELFLKLKKTRYNKLADGTPLFKAMQFTAVYRTCGYFRAFYDDLKKTAGPR